MQDFLLANSNFLAVALYMANTAMVDWIKVLEVCVSNRTTLVYTVLYSAVYNIVSSTVYPILLVTIYRKQGRGCSSGNKLAHPL